MRIPINNSDEENLPVGTTDSAESAESSADNEKAECDVKIGELTEKLAEVTSNWQRERANFQNYKKRVEEEKREFRKYASADFATDLLRVLDYFESALSFTENLPKEANNVIDGVKYTIEELSRVFDAYGIRPIFVETGMPYDSSVMEAVEREASDDFEADTVLEIKQRGWTIHDRVLRPCRVVVASEPEAENDNYEKDQK
ncbi:MAG: nucleotide exchange factor GrpE, partial [bacterium]